MNARILGFSGSLLLAAAILIACGSDSKRSGFGLSGDGGPDGQGPGFGGNPTGAVSECGFNNQNPEDTEDHDGDGVSIKDGDCNDCNAAINPGAHDIAGNGVDEDCSGAPDDEITECDENLALVGTDPFDGAKAIGLCKKADKNGKGWGVIEAKWVKPDGSPLSDMEGVGILKKLGVNAPQVGQAMLAISSGTARDPTDPGYESVSGHSKGYSSGVPAGYPKESPACPGVVTGKAYDGAGLELKIRVPTNAQSFSFQENFFTYEYSTFVCSTYNDFYVATLDPAPAGLPDSNIAFDQDGNPISVNNSLLQVCTPGTHKGKTFLCPLGTQTLSGTGFEGHAATGWLTTTAPVKPGSEITLRFLVWDSGDGILDSTTIIDDFKWDISSGETGTKPSPDPK
jgi:hypothetical protein